MLTWTVIIRLHGEQTEEFLAQEFTQIHDQILLENEGRDTGLVSSVGKLFSKQYFRRTATACFILMMGQLSGSTVIQNYQSIFYAAVGYTGRTGLLISGIYGFMGVFGQIAYLAFVADKWMRTRTLCKCFPLPAEKLQLADINQGSDLAFCCAGAAGLEH